MNNGDNGVPTGWGVAELSNVIPKAQYGISSSLDDENGIPVLRMNNLQGGTIDISELKFSTSAEAENLLLRPDDVLFNRTNSMAHVGRTSLWRGELPKASFASYLVRLIPDTNRLDAQYLVRWLNLPRIQIAIRCFATPGVHQVNINPTNLRKLAICLPHDVREQKKINGVLRTVDNLIEKTESLIAKYQAIKQGMMHDLFTRGVDAHGHLRPPQSEAPDLYKESELGWIPMEWDVRRLEYFYATPIRDFGSFSSTNLITFLESGIPFIKSEMIEVGKINWGGVTYISEHVHQLLSKSHVRTGDILFSKIGSALGKGVIYDGSRGECNSNAAVAKINVDPRIADRQFVTHFLNHEIAKVQLKSMIVSLLPRINLGDLSCLLVPTPATGEQSRIAERLLSADAAIKTEESSLQCLIALKTGLMQDLLTGKVRVNVDEAEEAAAHV